MSTNAPASKMRPNLRKLAVWFLTVQGIGVLAWWAVMLLLPNTRPAFMAAGAPDSTLLAFIAGDFMLYAGGSFIAAYGLTRRHVWAWPVLCIHAGAAIYAALYGLVLSLVGGGGGWLGGLLMLPSLVVLPVLVWVLRPGGSA